MNSLKLYSFLLTATVLGGCAAQNAQREAIGNRLDQIDSRLETLDQELSNSNQHLLALNESQAQSQAAVTDQLSTISDDMLEIPEAVSALCNNLPTVVVPVCETTDNQRVDVSSDKMLVGEL